MVYLVCPCSIILLNGLHTDEVFMTLELSEVETSRCAPLNQCDRKSSSGDISMIIATTLFMYHVDYNKL